MQSVILLIFENLTVISYNRMACMQIKIFQQKLQNEEALQGKLTTIDTIEIIITIRV